MPCKAAPAACGICWESQSSAATLWRMRNLLLASPWRLCAPAVWRRLLPWLTAWPQQNALFEEYYQAGLKNSPERATSLGDYRYNNLLSQHSLKSIADEHAEADAFLARLEKISTERNERPGPAEP